MVLTKDIGSKIEHLTPDVKARIKAAAMQIEPLEKPKKVAPSKGKVNPGTPGELAEPTHEELAKIALAALPNPFMSIA